MKHYITYILSFLCIFGLHGETVSQKEAQKLAHLFFNESAHRITAPPKLIYNGKRLTTDRLFTPFYVYNNSLGGFVIISAENKAYPILGYSLKENFDPEKLGETDKELLKSYAREIELIRYDGQPVEKVEKAWQNYSEYVNDILKAPYNATDPEYNLSDALLLVENAIETDKAVYADLYTPLQWSDLMAEELVIKKTIPLALYQNSTLFPMIIYGKQGDYFRIELTNRNSWLLRLNATDIIPANMISTVAREINIEDEPEESVTPFDELDNFIIEVDEIETSRRSVSSIDKIDEYRKPVIYSNGSGHYEIKTPEFITSAVIYNLSGNLVRRYKYVDTSMAYIDLSADPSGFYIVTLTKESGMPMSLKLYR